MQQAWYSIIKNSIIIIISLMLSSTLFAAPNPEGIQVYQKNMHLSALHKQNLAADIYNYQNADNIWDQLRQEFVLPHYEDSPQVAEQIEWFMNHQDFLLTSASRAAPYLYFILQQVHKRHLPPEVVLLPMIESSYNPFAYSTKGAAGIWQMMPGTATGFGIKQNWWYDGRRDVVASTRAALDYLSYLGSFFEGNWLLAIAAYDTGEGNILSAIRRNVRDSLNTDYWSLPLSQETRTYIPRLLALATIISHPDIYPISFPIVSNAPYLAQIDIGSQIDLKNAAELAGLSLKKLVNLNPGYNRSATDPNGPFKLVLPIEHVQQFTENFARSPLYQPINWMRYKIKSGDTLVTIAKKFNTSSQELRKANPTLGYNIKPGKYLVIPSSTEGLSETILKTSQLFASSNNSNHTTYISPVVSKSQMIFLKQINPLENFHGNYHLQPGDTLYMVRDHDNLQKIATHFHLSEKVLLAINHLPNTKKISPGDQLMIPTHVSQTNTAKKYALASGDTIYMIRRGDNIQKVADRFHTSISDIRIANLLTTDKLQEGDRLVIPTHVG